MNAATPVRRHPQARFCRYRRLVSRNFNGGYFMKSYATKMKVILLASLAVAAISAEAAGTDDAGRDKAKGSATCHRADGKGTVPLAGKKAACIAEQLRDFRSGARKHETMNMVSNGLNDQDIDDLAVYFAALK